MSSSAFLQPDYLLIAKQDASLVLVLEIRKAKKFLATVLSAAHECDLALLGVSSEEFWEDLEPMKFGGIPHLKVPHTQSFSGDSCS